jgi:hypothetical protein
MKRLACWLGRHRWKSVVEDGESYTLCSACGKTPRHRGRSPMTSADVEYMRSSGQSDNSISSGF